MGLQLVRVVLRLAVALWLLPVYGYIFGLRVWLSTGGLGLAPVPAFAYTFGDPPANGFVTPGKKEAAVVLAIAAVVGGRGIGGIPRGGNPIELRLGNMAVVLMLLLLLLLLLLVLPLVVLVLVVLLGVVPEPMLAGQSRAVPGLEIGMALDMQCWPLLSEEASEVLQVGTGPCGAG